MGLRHATFRTEKNPRARLDVDLLDVETFPTADEQQGTLSYTGSTGYCCDTRFHCSTVCRAPANDCELC